jgi:hypothetical protein
MTHNILRWNAGHVTAESFLEKTILALAITASNTGETLEAGEVVIT